MPPALLLLLAPFPPLPQHSPLEARCTFELEGITTVLDGLMACGDQRPRIHAAERALEHHANLHGWGTIDGFDSIPRERAAACPPRELYLLATVALPCADDASTSLRLHLAQCFERNGRIEQALRLLEADLDHALAALQAGNRGLRRPILIRRQRSRASQIAEHAARIAARHGRWVEALRYAERWTPTSTCSIGTGLEGSRIRDFRARCLLHLERLDEVRTLCIEAVTNPWSRDPSVVEPWIESYLRGNSPIAPELAVEMLAGFANPAIAEEIRAAGRTWLARR